jgi:nucleoside permease NupC
MRGILGVLALIGIAFLFSTDRRRALTARSL